MPVLAVPSVELRGSCVQQQHRAVVAAFGYVGMR